LMQSGIPISIETGLRALIDFTKVREFAPS
jgi:hypothetical protein